MQASFVAEEWVDHALGQVREAEDKKDVAEKAQAKSEQKLKDTLFHLANVEKSRKNVKAALTSFEKQAADSSTALRKAETQLTLAIVKVKQQQKQLEAKDFEKAMAEQASIMQA